jgi:hypothetical protein
LTWANSFWIPSNFQVVYLSDFSLFVTAGFTGTVQVKLFDLDTQETLDTFTITDPVTGWNQVRVERSYPTFRMALAYDSTQITSVRQQVPQTVVDWWLSTAALIYGPSCSGYIRGIETADLTGVGSFAESDNMHGLTANFSYQCRWDHLVCSNRQLFAYPLLHLLGAELMHGMQYSEELNRFNTVDREQAEKLIAQYYGEFTASLETACEGIMLDTSDACLQCNSPIQFVESHP